MTGYRPIFMIGVPRSGTSVLSEAIAAHPDLGGFTNHLNRLPGIPALAAFTRLSAIPGIGRRLHGKKKQAPGVAAQVRRVLPYLSEAFPVWERLCGPAFSTDYLIDRSASESVQAEVSRYVSRVLRLQGKARLFAKLTGPPRITYLLSLFPDAGFIHVIRDPRAVVASLMSVGFWERLGGFDGPWWQNGLTPLCLNEWEASGRSPAALAAIQWRRILEVAEAERRRVPPGRYLEIRYEAFVDAPHRSVSTVFDRMGLDDDPAAHRYLNGVGRLVKMNDKFRRLLAPAEIRMVERITGGWAARKGYRFDGED